MPKDGTRRASGRGAKGDPACCLPARCPQGQGGLGVKTVSTRHGATLLEALPKVVVPRRGEESGCHKPQSGRKPTRTASVRGARRLPGAPRGSEPGFGPRHTRPPEPGIPLCGAVRFRSRAGGGSSAPGSLQPGCRGALMGCGRCGFGPLGLRRERNPDLPLPQRIL